MDAAHLRRSSWFRISYLAFTLSILFLCSCSEKAVTPDSSYSQYISAYTGEMVSSGSDIRIVLAQDLSDVVLNESSDSKLFSFKPSLKGTTAWKSSREVVFTPDSGALRSGVLYTASFQLGKVMDIDKEHQTFDFSFKVIPQSFSVEMDKSYLTVGNDNKWVCWSGVLSTADKVALADVQKMLKASVTKKDLKIRIGNAGNGNQFQFLIDSIARTNQNQTVKLHINGSPIGVKNSEEKELKINALGTFEVIGASFIESDNSYIDVYFSDILDTDQSFKDLVSIYGMSDLTIQCDRNRLRIYLPFIPQATSVTLSLSAALKNNDGQKLGEMKEVMLSIASSNPQVQMLNKGNIMPDGESMILPFKTINLRSLTVSIIKVYENNILRFLQSNNYAGTNDLRSAGRMILKKRISLGGDPAKDLTRWNDFSIDLAPLIKKDPGAIYRVELTFGMNDAITPCNNQEGEINEQGLISISDNSGITAEDEAYWDEPYGYYSPVNYNWQQYVWKDRKNPCKPTYYMNSDIFAGTNVLSSNLGIMAESGTNGKNMIVVNNILTTKPEKDVKVVLYNYQLQPIGEASTDASGFAEITPKGGKPFLLTANKEKEKGYLKLDDASALSYSRFDVSGKEIQKGLRGYIYTERGVWRPGDSIYVTFILQDKDNPLPKHYPVIYELYTPMGKFYKKYVQTNSVNGFYSFKVATDPNAPTGRWESYIKVGGATFAKNIRIEAIKPNRLKMELKWGEQMLKGNEERKMTLTSSWLLGLPASNLKASVEMKLSPDPDAFSKSFPGYTFMNPISQFSSIEKSIFEGKLNGEGVVTFSSRLPAVSSSPGMLTANFISRVYEDGGDFSTYIQSAPYSPFSSYVGMSVPEDKNNTALETDKSYSIQIATVNGDGKPVSGTVEIEVYKLDWRWWWEKENGSLASYMNGTSKKLISRANIQTSNGKGIFPFEIKYPNWGRYLILAKDKNSGHITGKVIYMDWPAWRGQAAMSDPDGLTMLTFATDKESYRVGEKIKVTIPKASSGRAMVALENGSSVLSRQWVETIEGKETQFEIPVTSELAPNVYIHIVLLQPYAQKNNDLPIRLYGIKSVNVENQNTHLSPIVAIPEKLKPQQKFEVLVHEKNALPMTYTLAIVDEGLLDLTAFKTPNPWNSFYQKEALGVRSWDMYDWVMNSYAGSMAPLLSIGGDEELRNTSRNRANRFKPVVIYKGPYYLPKGKVAKHELQLPEYVGAVRVMVVAGNNDGAYGNVSRSVEVKNRIMTLSSLPRVLSPGDEIYLPVNLFVTDKIIKQASVSVSTSNNLLTVVGNNQQKVDVKAPEDKVIFFKLKAGDRTGKETITIRSSGSNDIFSETIEIEVRNANLPVTKTENLILNDGETKKLDWNIPQQSVNTQITLTTSAFPAINLTGRLNYLLQYPYGCTEQIISQAFPQLYLSQLIALSKEQKENIQTSVRQTIDKLYTLQNTNGGIAYWQGLKESNPWVSSYALAFISEAAMKGYNINADFMSKLIVYQRNQVRLWADAQNMDMMPDQMQEAFRLYSLALANKPDLGAMNRMREMSNLHAEAKWMLANTYTLVNKNEIASELITNVGGFTNRSSGFDSDFGSQLRDQSIALMTLLQLNRLNDAMSYVQSIAQQLSSDESYSTQSTAFALMSVSQAANKLGKGNMNFDWSLNKDRAKSVTSSLPLWEQKLSDNKTTGEVTVTNKQKNVLFAELSTTYTPLFDQSPALNKGISMQIKYVGQNGAALNYKDLMQGTSFTMIVEVTNLNSNQSYTNMALSQILPGGWEIVSTRYAGISEGLKNYTYQDIRDDRMLTFFDLGKGETKQFYCRIQASYAGVYYMPATVCEAMYDASVYARTTASEIKIKQE